MNSYHFSLGNSTDGAIGFCARINARNLDHAVRELQCRIDDHAINREVELILSKDEYVTVFFNPDAVSVEDITGWNDPDGREYKTEKPISTEFLAEVSVRDQEIEVHTCPYCHGTFGIDATFTDQVEDIVNCMMCSKLIQLGED